MLDAPPISDAEWEVMAVLWEAAGPLGGAAVVAALAGRRPAWSPRTVKSLLNRLLNKGVLAADTQGNRYLYRPTVTRDRCVRAAARSFLSRVFGGATGPMLVHLVTHAELSAAEVEHLQQLLGDRRSAGSRPLKKGR